MAAPPFMALYVADFHADTQHLVNADEFGAYLLILMTLWRREARLGNDEESLRRIAKVKPQRWPAIWRLLKPMFTISEDGLWISHKRLTEEYHYATETSRVRSEVGRKGGRAKALKNKKVRVANAKAKAQQNPAIHSHIEEDSSYRAISSSGDQGSAPVEGRSPMVAKEEGSEPRGQLLKDMPPDERRALLAKMEETHPLPGKPRRRRPGLH